MHRRLSALAALAVVVALALPAPSIAQGRERTKVGSLTCDISADIGLIIASKKELTCMFTPSQPGPREVYTGSIIKFGLDLGPTAGGAGRPLRRRAPRSDGRRRCRGQRPGRRLEPHREPAAGIGAGAGRPQSRGRGRWNLIAAGAGVFS